MSMEENSRSMDVIHIQTNIILKKSEEISLLVDLNNPTKELKLKKLFHHIMDSEMNKIH